MQKTGRITARPPPTLKNTKNKKKTLKKDPKEKRKLRAEAHKLWLNNHGSNTKVIRPKVCPTPQYPNNDNNKANYVLKHTNCG